MKFGRFGRTPQTPPSGPQLKYRKFAERIRAVAFGGTGVNSIRSDIRANISKGVPGQRVEDARALLREEIASAQAQLTPDQPRIDLAEEALRIIDEEIALARQRESDRTFEQQKFADKILAAALHRKNPADRVRRLVNSELQANYRRGTHEKRVRDAQTFLQRELTRVQATDAARARQLQDALDVIASELGADVQRAEQRNEEFRDSDEVREANVERDISSLADKRDAAGNLVWDPTDIDHLKRAWTKIKRRAQLGLRPSRLGHTLAWTPREREMWNRARRELAADLKEQTRREAQAEKTRTAAEKARQKEAARIVNATNKLPLEEIQALERAQEEGRLSEDDLLRFYALRGGWGNPFNLLGVRGQRHAPLLNNSAERAFLSRIVLELENAVWRPERERRKAGLAAERAATRARTGAAIRAGAGNIRRRFETPPPPAPPAPDVIPTNPAEGKLELTDEERRLIAVQVAKGKWPRAESDIYIRIWDRTAERGVARAGDTAEEQAVRVMNGLLEPYRRQRTRR